MAHDQNFKNLILDYPLAALAFFAAEEASEIDPAVRILPIRQEQLQERLGARFRELDTPLLVEWPDGRREALLFVIEEESTTRNFSVHRLAHYCLDLAELLASERLVPVVIFLRHGSHPGGLELGGDRHIYLSFRYLACQLPGLSAEHYLESDNIVARLNLPNMAYPPERKVEIYARAVQGLLTLEEDPEKKAKYLDFIDIYAALDDNEQAQYRAQYAEESEQMSRFAERFIQQGVQQGLDRGLQQGEARMLIRQLTRRFGELPEETRRRIEQADAETLLEWSDRVLTASNLDEVLH